MNKITWFKDYLQHLQDTIVAPQGLMGINRNRMVIDDSQLTKYLSDHQTDHNLLLIGVMPEFGNTSTDGDNFKLSTQNQFMIVKKTSYSEVNYDEYFKIFEDTYIIAELVVKKLLEDSLGYNQDNLCTPLRFLITSSINIVPVWNKSSCNGWSITFNFDNYL